MLLTRTIWETILPNWDWIRQQTLIVTFVQRNFHVLAVRHWISKRTEKSMTTMTSMKTKSDYSNNEVFSFLVLANVLFIILSGATVTPIHIVCWIHKVDIMSTVMIIMHIQIMFNQLHTYVANEISHRKYENMFLFIILREIKNETKIFFFEQKKRETQLYKSNSRFF